MGKGDRKTRRGKLYRGSFGKTRPKHPRKRRKHAGRSELARRK
jgi:ribosomal small subunit protein bTHX